jgi:hypothetical protein
MESVTATSDLEALILIVGAASGSSSLLSQLHMTRLVVLIAVKDDFGVAKEWSIDMLHR